jgi:HTH-type transcriptional regulator / antitoxin HigA
MTAIAIKPTKHLTARYLELLQEFPLRPIENKTQLEAATAIIDRLAPLSDPDRGELNYLNVLADLVDTYERRNGLHYQPKRQPLEMLRFLMDQHNMNQRALAKKLGVTDAAVSLILSGERPITADHARAFGKIFSVDAGLFL